MLNRKFLFSFFIFFKIQAFEPTDSSSYSNIDDVSTTHLVLDLKIDFLSKTIKGECVHVMKSKIDEL